MITFAAIVPHPPAIIPSVGKSQTNLLRKTISSFEQLSDELRKSQPHTLVVVSPHGQMRYDKFAINLEDAFKGSFSDFGDFDDPEISLLNNSVLAKTLFERLRKKNFPVEVIREQTLDYGTLVPLYHLLKSLEKKPRLITLTFTALDWEMHYNFGKIIGQVFEEVDQNIAFIASADLSQRIAETSPAGFSPYGLKFDQTLMQLLKDGETERILNLNPEFCNEAGQCGLRSIIMALGAIYNRNYNFEQLSYENPQGVGHLVGKWKFK